MIVSQPARRIAPAWALLTLLAPLASVCAGEIVIYDEALRNGFVSVYSYGGGSTFDSQVQSHSPTHSVEFVGNNYNAVSFTHPTASFDTVANPILHFWIRGTAPGGQQLQLYVKPDRDSDVNELSMPLDGFIAGGSISATVWREVTVPLDTLGFAAPLERVDLQSEAGGAVQTAVYIDDMSLLPPNQIFKNGFDDTIPPPPSNALVQDTTTVDNLLSDRFTWYDSTARQRVAVLAHNDGGTAPGGSRGGELREFRYQTAGGQRVISAPGRLDGGFGYIVSHPHFEDHCVGGDSSTLGHLIAGTWTPVFTGRHHAIFRFHQNYPRYCTTAPPAAEHDIPVTIDWMFSTGRDNPVWAVTYDMNGFPADTIDDDSRAPYGTLNIDGSSGTFMDNFVGGIDWGDRYRFTTTGAPPATLNNSTWDWTAQNKIPFVELWMSGVDATMGLAQTQTMDQQDAGGGRLPYAGGYDVSAYWGGASPTIACPDGSYDGQTGLAHKLPCVQHWPFQANSFSYGDLTNPTNDAKMTWGTQYGFLGKTAYNLHDSTLAPGSTAPGHPRKSYSVYIVLGEHTGDPVGTQAAQVKTAQSIALSINGGVGSVATGGAAGVTRPDSITYSPAGYDPIFGALTFNAASNALDANLSVGSGTLSKPLIVIRNYTSGSYPLSVKFGGATLVMDVDYFPSLRNASSELWITLNKDVTATSKRLQITP